MKELVTPPIQNSTFFENDPKGIPAGVQVKGLTKVKTIFLFELKPIDCPSLTPSLLGLTFIISFQCD